MRFWGIVIVCVSFLVQGALAQKLALVVSDPEAATAADLLTAELSKTHGIQVLERGEISRILLEKHLIGPQKDNTLGQILGADGLLILERRKNGTNQTLDIRLVAVKPGVVLARHEYLYPVPEIAHWSEVAAAQFVPLLPKLSVVPEDAVRISILNVRSPTQSPESTLLDREVTLLLSRRLMHEKAIFVLERSQLGGAALEKAFQREDTQFWNGSYLVEGAINPDGYASNIVRIRLHLKTPEASADESFEASSPPSGLPRVMDDLVQRLLRRVTAHNSPNTWQPEEEANRYYEEAKWALRWGMFTEAESASESAWALGRHDADTARARVLAYSGESQTDGPGATVYLDEQRLSFDRPSPPWKLDAARESLNAFLGLNSFVTGLGMTNTWWIDAGSIAVVKSSELLEEFYWTSNARTGLEDKLDDLRGLVRQSADLIMAHALKHFNANSSPPDILAKDFYNFERPDIFDVAGDYGGLWQETFEQGVAFFKKLRRNDITPNKIWDKIYHREPEHPPLADWHSFDLAKGRKIWAEFLRPSDSGTATAPGVILNRSIPKEITATEWIDRQRDFLRTNTTFNLGEFTTIFWLERYRYTTNQARELLGLLASYRTNLSATTNVVGDAQESHLKGLEARLKVYEQPFVPQPGSRTNLQMRIPEPPSASTNTILVTNLWKLLTTALEPKAYPEVQVTSHIFRENKMWLRVHYSSYTQTSDENGGAFSVNSRDCVLSIDPLTSHHTVIQLPEKNWDPGEQDLEVLNGVIYASTPETVNKYDAARKSWNSFPIKFQKHPRLQVVGRRLFAIAPDSIAEIETRSGSVRVVASARRRPQINLLDSLTSLEAAILGAGPNNGLRVYLEGAVYDLSETNCSQVVTLPFSCTAQNLLNGFLFNKEADAQNRWGLYFLPSFSTNLQHCLDTPPILAPGNTSATLNPPPTWKLPAQIDLTEGLGFAQTNGLSFLNLHFALTITKEGKLILRSKNGRHANLVYCGDGLPQAIVLPVIFDLDRGPIPEARALGAMGFPKMWIETTPSEIVIGNEAWLGFWRISFGQIEKAVQNEISKAAGRL